MTLRARGQAAKILFVLWNDSAFCSSLFAMNEIESFLAPVALEVHTRPLRMLLSFKPFSKIGTAHIFSSLEQIGYLAGFFAWITWMAIYIHLTGAISGYIIMCKRINLESWGCSLHVHLESSL
ncbi:hypothetical protein ACROYT_G040661 [Oculina patagonica]